MGFLDKIFGEKEAAPAPGAQPSPPSDDAKALERYRYLLRTAPPEAIEQAHAEAFAQLTPAQRAQVLRELSEQVPPGERTTGPAQDDPQTLARMATRAEIRQPGTLERAFGGGGGGGGGMGFGGSLLTSVAGGFIGSAIAHELFSGLGDDAASHFGESRGLEDAQSYDAGEEIQDDPAVLDDGGDVGDSDVDDSDVGDMGGDFGDV